MPAIQIRLLISLAMMTIQAFWIAAASAAGPSLLKELPVRITEPGIYRVAKNLQYDAERGAAITIDADDVTIDLNGQTVSGTAGTDTLAVGVHATGQRGLSVSNGTISGFYFGIDIRDHADQPPRSARHVISGVSLVRNHYFGMRLVGDHSLVRQCTVAATGGSSRPKHSIPHGMRLVGNENVVRQCVIIDLRLQRLPEGRGEIVGVHFDAAKDAIFEDNYIVELANHEDDEFDADDRQERRFGMWVNGGPRKDTFVRVRRNTFSGFPVPLAFAPGSDGQVTDNTFYGAGPKPVRGHPAEKATDNVSLSPLIPEQ